MTWVLIPQPGVPTPATVAEVLTALAEGKIVITTVAGVGAALDIDRVQRRFGLSDGEVRLLTTGHQHHWHFPAMAATLCRPVPSVRVSCSLLYRRFGVTSRHALAALLLTYTAGALAPGRAPRANEEGD